MTEAEPNVDIQKYCDECTNRGTGCMRMNSLSDVMNATNENPSAYSTWEKMFSSKQFDDCPYKPKG